MFLGSWFEESGMHWALAVVKVNVADESSWKSKVMS